MGIDIGLAAGTDSPKRARPPSPALTFRLVRSGDDPDDLMALFETAHRETRFGAIRFSNEKVSKLMLQIAARTGSATGLS